MGPSQQPARTRLTRIFHKTFVKYPPKGLKSLGKLGLAFFHGKATFFAMKIILSLVVAFSVSPAILAAEENALTPKNAQTKAKTCSLLKTDDVWMTDYSKALEKAKAEKKMVLMDFTGSDWCGWCIKLDKEIFNQKQFQGYADKNLILLKLDFPQRKAQSESEKKQNKALSDQYKIEGFPTVIVLDSEGKQIGQLGYREGGPSAFIAELDELKK